MSLSHGCFLQACAWPRSSPTPRKSAGTTEAPHRLSLLYLLSPSLLFLTLKGLLSTHTPFLGDLTYFQHFTRHLGIDFQAPTAVPDSVSTWDSVGSLCCTMSKSEPPLKSVAFPEFPSSVNDTSIQPPAQARNKASCFTLLSPSLPTSNQSGKCVCYPSLT